MTNVDELKSKLRYALSRLDAANELMAAAERQHEVARELGGGIPGFGGSGNQRAAGMVRASSERAQRMWKEATERIEKWKYQVKRLEHRIAEAERVKLTDGGSIKDAQFVKASGMWWRVARVNAKSVTVHYPGASFTERITIDRVEEWR